MIECKQRIISTDSIRENAKLILDQSKDILTVDYNSISDVLAPLLISFQEKGGFQPFKNAETLSLEKELGVTLSFDVVNFCFKDPSTGNEYVFETKGKKIKRSSGLFAALKESDVDWNNLITVASLSPEKWKKITQLTETNTLYLGEERGVRIRGFAKQLLDFGHKTAQDFIMSTGLDTTEMLSCLSKSGYFNDEFLKRGQLTVRMLDDVFKEHGALGFKNSEILTAMADYRLPQVFYNLGVVRLSEDLLLKLLKEDPIKADSPGERALRATVIVVAERLSKIMNMNEGNIDTLLWNLSQKMAKDENLPIPHMLVATDKY